VAKANVRRQIQQATLAIKAIMQENLEEIGQALVDQIMARLSRLQESKRLEAIIDLELKGQAKYKEAMLGAIAVIASDALRDVRLEVPKAKRVQLSEEIEGSLQLGEFERLPASIRNKVFRLYQLLSETQLDDLEKAVVWQFNHSVDSTDSLDTIRADLEDAAYEFTSGNRIAAGASSISAQVINETRNEFFSDPDVQEQIDAFEFVNGDPVSEICQDLAGTIFDKDDPNRFRYTPPLHFNCKSYIAPILSGNLKDREIEKLQPSSKRIEDTIQFSEHLCCGRLNVVAEKQS